MENYHEPNPLELPEWIKELREQPDEPASPLDMEIAPIQPQTDELNDSEVQKRFVLLKFLRKNPYTWKTPGEQSTLDEQ